MALTFICSNCREEKGLNPRLKGHQSYCGEPDCQRARKARWQRQKVNRDAEYKNRQQQSLKKWRKKRPLHQYQNCYRMNHPHYVNENRQKQKGSEPKTHKARKFSYIAKDCKNGHVNPKPNKSAHFPHYPVEDGRVGKDCKNGRVIGPHIAIPIDCIL